MYRGWVTALLGISVSACQFGPGADSNERVALSTAALEARVSAPFDVEAMPTEFNLTSPGNAQLACGKSHCFMIYNLVLRDDKNHVFGTRFDATGARLDAPSVEIAKGEFIIAVGARDDEFLAVTTKGYSSTSASNTGPYHYYRIRGSDGSVIADDVAARLPTSRPVRIVSTGNTWMIAYPNANGTGCQLSVYDPSFQAVGTPYVLSECANFVSGDIAPGPGQYVAVAYGKYVRINETTGQLLDAAPVTLSAFESTVNGRAVYFNGVFQIVSGNGYEVRGWRVNAETGALLDVDDTFNGKSGAKSIYKSASSASVSNGLDLDVFDGDVVVSFFRTAGDLAAVRLDVATGLPATSTVDTYISAVQSVPYGERSFEFHSIGQTPMLMSNGGLMQVGSVEAKPWVAGFSGTWTTAAVPSYDRFSPQVASNGNGYLAVWAVGSATYQQGSKIMATRIDANTGAYLDNPPVQVGTGEYPMVVSNGSDYLIGWLSTANATTRGYTSIFHADGTRSNGVTHYISQDVQGFVPQAAFNGDYGVSTWGGQAARTDQLGNVLRADGLEAGDSPYYELGFMYDLGKPSARVVADTTPAPDRRTFLVVGKVNAPNFPNIAAMRIRSATGAMLGPTVIAEAHDDPFAATDGTHFLVVSRNGGSANWDAVFVDPITGLPIPETKKQIVTSTTERSLGVSALFFDGTNYNLVLTSSGSSTDSVPYAFLRRYDTSLNRVAEEANSDGTKLTGGLHLYSDCAAVNQAPGRSLFAFDAVDPARAGNAIKGVFIAADGSTPSVGSGGSSGAAGAGNLPNPMGGAGGSSVPANGGVGVAGANATAAGGASGAPAALTGGVAGNASTRASGGAAGIAGTPIHRGGSAVVASDGGATAVGGSTQRGSTTSMTAGTLGGGGESDVSLGGQGSTATPAGAGASSRGTQSDSEGGRSSSTRSTKAVAGAAAVTTPGQGVAGFASGSSNVSEGCLCRAGSPNRQPNSHWWLLVGGVVVTLRRRTARRRAQ
jgi:hypothetical protein